MAIERNGKARDRDPIQDLARHAASIASGDIPDDVMRKAAELLEDTVGCILAGGTADGIEGVRDSMLLWGGRPQATVLGFGDRTSVPSAAFVNAAMGHARDFDDTHDAALNHGCVVLVPALLALAEFLAAGDRGSDDAFARRKVSGQEFIAALAVGLDVSNRLGMAFIPYLHTGWLPTTLWGPFGVVAACGRLLGFDEERMGDAFGLAYSTIHGNRQALVDGRLAKRVQPGFSAQAGVQAVFLAARGITAARRIIGGDFGIPALYTSGKCDVDRLTGGLGRRFETSNISLKPYPSCRCTHPVIDAAKALRDEHGITWEDIEEGTIFLPPQSMGQVGNPFRIRDDPTVDAQFSAQYTAALMFTNGAVSLADFGREAVLAREQVAETAARFATVEFQHGASGPVPVEMSVTCRDGRCLEARVEKPGGSPENPMSEEDRTRKFNDCLDFAVGAYTDQARAELLGSLRGVLAMEDVTTLSFL